MRFLLPATLLLIFGFQPFQGDAPLAGPNGQSGAQSDAALPRGKKLVLKDGTFHMVREYKVDGGRGLELQAALTQDAAEKCLHRERTVLID